MLRRWLGSRSNERDGDLAWSIALSPSGERLLALDGRAGIFKAPVISIGQDGRLSVRDASAKRGRTFRLAEAPASAFISSASSLILGSMEKAAPVFAVAPVIRKGQKPEVAYSKGKIHAVSVERVVDDGAETGIWRGFVVAEGRTGEVFLELAPPPPLPEGADTRIVGLIDDAAMGVEAGRKARFRRGAWIPVDERIALFATDLIAEIGSSDDTGADGSLATIGSCLAAAAALHHGRKRTKELIPFTCTPIGFDETPAQKGFRRRMMAANEGGRAAMPFSAGRRMAIPATDWHGAVQENGDIILEIRREPFAVRPSSVTVILSRTMVATSDGLPSRIGIRCTFADGSSVSMLLGGGPQHLAKEIAKRRNVVVVQGKPGTKTYGEISMSVAGVEGR
jgi:hypothetical protein